jgi:oligopeptide/dipeptide ABC transporter ATP-binding protein
MTQEQSQASQVATDQAPTAEVVAQASGSPAGRDNGAEPLIKVESLVKYYPIYGGILRRKVGDVQAVDDVSFEIQRGEIFGLVGESGCGKSTLGRLIVRLLTPDAGRVVYRGREISTVGGGELRSARTQLQMVFQDPYSSLNPRLTVGQAIAEPLRVHDVVAREEVAGEVKRLLEQVGLAHAHAKRYPFELSGGQRQRVGIARALSVRPAILIADEAVSGLDVSIQAQVLNLLADLRDELDLTLVFISHDLGVVEYLSDRIGVMYLGRLVEFGAAATVFRTPGHPYTAGLLNAIPLPDPTVRTRAAAVSGELPSAVRPPSGCVFRTRCPLVQPICETMPPTVRLGDGGHWAACHFAGSTSSR